MYFSGYACDSFKKRNLHRIMQISPSSLKCVMLFDLDSNVNISSHYSRQFIALAIKNVIVLMRHSRFNMHLQLFLLLFYSLTSTSFTLGFFGYTLAQPVTFLASDLCLSIHSWGYLHHLHCNSLAFTVTTFFNFTASFPITISTDSVSSNINLFDSSQKYLFQSYFQFDEFGLHFLWFVISLFRINKVRKKSSWRTSILHSFFTILVIKLPLLRIAQSIIYFFQVFKAIWISSFVGVFFERFFPKSFLNLLGSGILWKFKQLIILGSIDLFLFLSSLARFLILPITLIFIFAEKHNSTIQ